MQRQALALEAAAAAVRLRLRLCELSLARRRRDRACATAARARGGGWRAVARGAHRARAARARAARAAAAAARRSVEGAAPRVVGSLDCGVDLRDEISAVGRVGVVGRVGGRVDDRAGTVRDALGAPRDVSCLDLRRRGRQQLRRVSRERRQGTAVAAAARLRGAEAHVPEAKAVAELRAVVR